MRIHQRTISPAPEGLTIRPLPEELSRDVMQTHLPWRDSTPLEESAPQPERKGDRKLLMPCKLIHLHHNGMGDTGSPPGVATSRTPEDFHQHRIIEQRTHRML